MRIDRVEAHAFGPFEDRRLEFDPGMTVVYGPNESGKSSWHAAIYGGLCGLRHVGGRPLTEDRLFEERHRPWDRDDDAWHASVYVTLGDGRRIHFHADLDGRNDYARDADSGENVVADLDLDNDNAPDGARLLGLTRRTILATIQVRQADVLHVLEAPDGLQEHLQQAAASGGDTTAEKAIKRLDDFHSERVGTMHHASKRPLKASHDAVRQLEDDLDRVRRAHEEYLDLHTQLDEARGRAAALERRVQAARAAAGRKRLTEFEEERARAADLRDELPDERPDPGGDDERLQEVTDALAAWDNRPGEPSLHDGPSAAELQAHIDELPPEPEGERSPAAEVEQAAGQLEDARRQLRFHRDSEPPPAPTADESKPAEPEPGPAWPPARIGLVGGGGALVLVGGALLATGAPAVGGVLALVGIAGLVAGLVRSPGNARDAAAVARRVAERERMTWEQRRDRLQEQITDRERQLREVLADHGVGTAAGDSGPTDELLAAYREACRRRRDQADQAAARDELESRLRARREAEQAAERSRRRRRQARERLRAAAERVGVSTEDPDGLAGALREWRREVRAAQKERARLRDRWTEFETLMDGRTLEDLDREIEQMGEQLPAMPDGIDPQEAERLADRREQLSRQAGEARERVANLEGRIADKEGDFESVVEAEESLQRARTERAQVEDLDETLQLTRRFLDDARERVQRDIAPRLRAAVEAHLPRITLGRYARVRVDPDSLDVEVSPDGTRWRAADRLSQGTAEQIYLLLRVAMAEHAVTTDEVAPLILDDVTVQSDRTRTERLLGLLHELSDERQIIVFSQEPHVLRWAREHLRDRAVVELDPDTIPA